MTNEEMIKAMFPEIKVERNGYLTRVVAQQFSFIVETDWLDAPYENKTSIKALEQQPCEDCISREYVIALLENKKRTRKEITNRIYEAPFVTPQRPKAKWIKVSDTVTNCSNCGKSILTVQNWFLFCPCCGADMRGDEDDI